MCKTAAETVVVTNAQGLHARPAESFAKLAMQFDARIDVTKDQQTVDGKSILDILTLFAEQGTELSLRATGKDAEEAIEALADLVNQGFVDNKVVDGK